MVTVFCSGSCRLLRAIHNGRGKIEPVHSMFHNFVGINFLGKLHNIKQHIQFIRWIKDEIELPENILNSFLTSYANIGDIEDPKMNPSKKERIKNALYHCDYYIFEICSLKCYERDGYQVQFELTHNYTCLLQSETDLYNDLKTLRDLIPKGKNILFQIHFRPNIIYDDASKSIDKREILYNVVNNFCTTNDNTYLYDPSVLLKKDISLFDDTHFNDRGYELSFTYLYDNFIEKSAY